jgi:hypothetical protein
MTARVVLGATLVGTVLLALCTGSSDVDEIVVVLGWLVLGMSLMLPPRGIGSWLPIAVLTATTAAQVVRLRTFVGVPQFPPEDFAIVFASARRLYRLAADPYLDPRANSFPFPAYAMADAAGLWGRLEAADAARLFFVVNALALIAAIVAVMASARLALGHQRPTTTLLLMSALLVHPGTAQVLLFGQTGIFVLFWTALGVWTWQRGDAPWLPALAFTLAAMQKPYLLLAAAFFMSWWGRDVIDGRGVSREGQIGRAILVITSLFLVALVVIPGGVTLTTFRQFAGGLRRLHETYSQSWRDNYSAVAIALHAAERLRPFDYGVAVRFGSALAVVSIVAAGIVSLRGSSDRLFAGLAWVAASLLPFAIVYKHYYPWLIPALFPALRLALERRIDAGTALLVCGGVALLHCLSAPGFTLGVAAVVVACQLLARRTAASAAGAVPA